MAYILDKLTIKAEVINLSITNHSNELVCAVKPNMYTWLIDIFKRLPQDLTDLYNPTGCWSPTFKASYTDIAVLVQYAIKHINLCFEQNKPLRNFHLSTESSDGFTIKLNQY
jgi:ferritin-like protein